MTKYLLFLLPLLGFTGSITMEKATLGPLGKIIYTNAEITQLPEQKQEILSRLNGHIEHYYVTAGKAVKRGDKIALIESIELSKMSAEYVSVLKQTKAAKEQLNTAKTLYSKGLSSQNDISNAIINLEEILAKKNALTSQLNSLGIKPGNLTEATDQYTLYAHSDGIVSKILTPLHANIDAKTPLMSLKKKGGYHATAFLSISDAMQTNKDTKGYIDIAGNPYLCHFVQLLPMVDEETQRAQVRFIIDEIPHHILLGAFTKMQISLPPVHDVLMVKKSALTLFQGEWVVFVKAEEAGHSEAEHKEDSHAGHRDDSLEENHDTDDNHEGHGHDEHEEEPAPYKARVVEVITHSGDYVAINGLEAGEEYVSDGVWFVKSMLLRSSLGGHGH